MRDGRQVISAYGWRNGEIGPFSGLDARYAPRWHGPWAGMRLDTLATEKWRAQIGIRRQWFDYRAEADWNLRADFQHPVSYTHEGKSRGWLGEASLIRRLSAHASLSLRLAYQKQALKNGKDTVFFSDGKQGSTRLNEVNWQSWSVLLGYRLDF
jgi:hypothetical protein